MERVLFAPRELPPPPPDVAENPSAYSAWVTTRQRARSDAQRPHHKVAPLRVITVVAGDMAPTAGQTLRSLARQTCGRWRLEISTTAPWLDGVEELVRSNRALRLRGRVRVVVREPGASIVEQMTNLLATKAPESVALIALGDIWEPDAVATLANLAPDEVLYADEDLLLPTGEFVQPVLKPDFSPDFLLSTGYIGRPFAIGHGVAGKLPHLVAQGTAELEHDVALAACEIAHSVVHVPEVLCHRTEARQESVGTSHVEEALRRRAETGAVTIGSCGTFHVLRSGAANPLVSILVPFRDQPRFLRTCVDSVRATTRTERVEFVLIDNGSSDLEMLTLMEELSAYPDVTLLSDPSPFNWARLNNEAAAVARGDVLLFLNDDIEARRDGWLSYLTGHTARTGVGCVGARLLYPNGHLQHCGVVLGLGGAAGHPLIGLPGEKPGYLRMASATRECIAVTGACLASRRSVFEQMGGFDVSLGVDLNDIDYCLRAGAAGYRTVFEPRAELVHHESPSRGTAGGVGDILKFIDRWEARIREGDPYFSPHLTRTSPSCGLAGSDEEEIWNTWYATARADS